MPRRQLSNHKDRIIDLVINKGVQTNCVAERFGVATSAIANILRTNGYEFEPTNKTWNRAASK